MKKLKVRNCEVCGNEYNPRGGRQRTCEEHLGMKKIECQTCGVELIIDRQSNRKYCDPCRTGERKCGQCGQLYTPNEGAKKSLYCSTECSHKARYEEGRYFKKMEHGYKKTGRNAKDWELLGIAKKVCYQHHERKCYVCGFDNDSQKVHVHHIDEDRTNNEPENLIPLCDPCHRMVHVLIRREKERPDQKTLNKLAEVVNLNLLKTGKPKP